MTTRPAALRRAVFLDRDGTLHVERDFCRRPQDVETLPGVREALHALRAAGYALVVVTNQSGIARGLLDEITLAGIHEELQRQLGGCVDAFFHCPHHPSEGLGPYTRACSCRKPASGLFQEAAAILGLAFEGSWVIGDSARDLLAAPAPVRGILVCSGKPPEHALAELRSHGRTPDAVVPDLAAAARIILATPPPD